MSTPKPITTTLSFGATTITIACAELPDRGKDHDLREAIARAITLSADLPRTRENANMLSMLDSAKYWLDRAEQPAPAEQPERETDSGEIAKFELARCRLALGQIRARCLNPGGSLESVPLWTDAPGDVLVAVQRALDRLERHRRAAASEVEAVRAERDHAREQLRACEV